MIDTSFDRSFIRIDEGLIHYRHTGPIGPGTRPLIMLHASPASSQSQESLAKLLTGTSLIMPDTPGNGLSSPPNTAKPDIVTYADMLDRTCVALGLTEIDLYGTHTGAHIAIEWAIAHPTRIRRLILDGVALMPEAERTEFLEHYAPPQKPDISGTQFPWAWNMIRDQMIFWPHYKKDAAHLRQGGAFDAQTLHSLTLDLLGSLETYHQPYEAVFRHDPTTRLPLVKTPTLWLEDAASPLDTDVSAALVASMPDAKRLHVTDLGSRASAILAYL